jgi:hypothetical protein
MKHFFLIAAALLVGACAVAPDNSQDGYKLCREVRGNHAVIIDMVAQFSFDKSSVDKYIRNYGEPEGADKVFADSINALFQRSLVTFKQSLGQIAACAQKGYLTPIESDTVIVATVFAMNDSLTTIRVTFNLNGE